MACGCAQRREMIKTAYQAGGTTAVFRAMPSVVKHMVKRNAGKPSVPILFKR